MTTMTLSDSWLDAETHPILLSVDNGCVRLALCDELDGWTTRELVATNGEFLFDWEKVDGAELVTSVIEKSTLGQAISFVREVAPPHQPGGVDADGADLAACVYNAVRLLLEKQITAHAAQAAIVDAACAAGVDEEAAIDVMRTKYNS